MRLLLSAYRAAFLKNYATVVRELADRGHAVEILLEEPWRHIRGQDDVVGDLDGYRDRIRIVHAPLRRRERWRELAVDLRSARDHLEFLDPVFIERYRARSRKRTPRLIRLLETLMLGRSHRIRRGVTLALERFEAAIPPSPELVERLRSSNPDALVLTPFMFLRNPQPDLLHAARALGIPAGVAVHSWDNLSSKAIIRPRPDRVFVWNEAQRREAVTRHGLDAVTIEVTGAQCHDALFEAVPRSREEFCSRVGLDPERPFLLYGCCSPWTFQTEVDFIVSWLDALRAAGGVLAEIGVMIRPHPKRLENWAEFDTSRWGDVVIWPRDAELPTGGSAWDDYRDSLAHCAGLVGLNTSLMVEAAALRKPVFTVLAEGFEDVQHGTNHFAYLVDPEHGALTAARTMGEHLGQLESVLGDPEPAARRAEAFAQWFLRPHGASSRATDHFCDAVQALSALPRAPSRARRSDPVLRVSMRVGMAFYDALQWTWRRANRRTVTTP